MPELYSRMDDAHWLTPSISDILEQGAAPPGGDGSIRDHMLTIQRELADMDTPAKIINVRSMPSYTLYVARPETVGRLGSRRTITVTEIRRSLARVAEGHTDWLLGFIPKLQEDETTLGILLRTSAHRPLSLRRLLVRGNFRSAPANHSFTLGITLEQNLIVRDLASTGHLLIVGGDNAKLHFLRSMLLTLILLNTPSELRLILAGKSSENFKALIATPHSLGRLVTQADGLQKVIDGLNKEVERRQVVFAEHNVTVLDAYNASALLKNKPQLPRILVLIDSLSEPEWGDLTKGVLPILANLLKVGADLGVHLLITTLELEQFPDITALIPTQMIMRTVAKTLTDQIPDFHPSLLRFIDALVVEKSLGTSQITPVELCSTTNAELINAIAYWQQNRQQRQQDTPGNVVSEHTGVTDLLTAPEPAPLVPTVAEPYKNPLTRNTAILLDRDAVPETNIANITPVATSTMETQEAVPTPITDTQTKEDISVKDANAQLQSAIALGAYLGWISIGALMDVLALTHDEASHILAVLKQIKIIENSDHPTPRFLLPSQKQ